MTASFKHSRLWKDIISIGTHSSIIYNNYLGNCLIKVGNGNRIKFWHDKWCGTSCLKIDFPHLFNLSTDKEGSLHQFFARKISSTDWNLPHRRVLYVWELAEEARLLGVLSSAPSLSLDRADCLSWACASTNSSEFSVSSLYSLSSSNLGPNLRICKSIWNKTTPPKVSFFCWLAWKNKIKSAEFLHRLGILDSSVSILCPFCRFEPESAVHVLLLCPFSWLIWSSFIHDWGFFWCINNSVEGLLNWWLGVRLKSFDRLIWRAIPLIVLWSIWKHKNECVFFETQSNFFGLCELIKIRAAFWLKASIKNFPFSIDDLAFKWNQIRLCS
ncbi:uncharacterized protein LOC114323149 [Camellia sinensis]|uniref:uncharacterized protein LOC114323149 n=1 Tax=Camellia sinensis TaxID=4442 RepID=UPI001035F1E7|nr:uncharacterized protein LOC114323149 [Camellia sinensis]